MKVLQVFRSTIIAALLFVFVLTACTGNIPVTEAPAIAEPATSSPAPVASEEPTTAPETTVEPTPVLVPVSGGDVMYEDNFTDPGTNWTSDKFDNYFIGYHEPEYYHIEVTSPNYKTTVFEPNKRSFDDFTVELQVLANSTKTAPTGDFRYGIAFRRSGDQYYAFTVSPRTKTWYLLKSSPSALEVLKEGTDENISDLDSNDLLRIDAQGSDFAFHINDRLVAQITDEDYTKGEIGFYVESFDSPNTHIHFDALQVRNYEPPTEGELTFLYQDNFTDPATSWPDKKFDNYFIGYHEPEYYHVEVNSSNYKTTVFEPGKQTYGDATIDLQVMTASSKTAPEGDFRYGLAFRRSGDQYYAFTISPRTKTWYVLKSSPNALEILKEGTNEDIHDLDVVDTLRVDAQGPNLLFHINDKLIAQVTDADYSSGEVGFYVESFDSPNTHIHFDTLTVRNFEVSVICNVNALSLNVRSGPGTNFPSSTFLSTGNTIEPIGRSPDNQWIQIKTDDSDNPGWVFNSRGFLSCAPDIELLPVINP